MTRLLFFKVGTSYRIRVQLPLTLGDDSEPEPDIAIISRQEMPAKDRHPSFALLVIEVAHSSRDYDRTQKASLYARFGIPEYWVIDVSQQCIEIYTRPGPELARYRSLRTLTVKDSFTSESVDELSVSLKEVFGSES